MKLKDGTNKRMWSSEEQFGKKQKWVTICLKWAHSTLEKVGSKIMILIWKQNVANKIFILFLLKRSISKSSWLSLQKEPFSKVGVSCLEGHSRQVSARPRVEYPILPAVKGQFGVSYNDWERKHAYFIN
jgi:hypothetical protein